MGNKSSSQLGNHRDEVRGRDRKNRERKDTHEKIEGLSSDNNPNGGDPHVAKQTSDDKEQDDTKLKLSPHLTEALPKESSDEASLGSIIQAAASPADVKHLEKEAEPNLEENLLVTNEVEASNSTSDRGSELLCSSITDDRQETKVPQTQDKSMSLSENKDTKQAVNESNTDEVDSSQSGLVMVGSDSGIGMEKGEKQELPATECSNKEEEIKEKVIEAIEKQELDTGSFPSAGNEAEDSGAVELRRSPSFDFDISTEARPGSESVQTPLLHHKKNRTRSPSLFDGSYNGVENMTVQHEAVSPEEKTIEVARSDSDRSRGNLQNLLKEEEGKANVVVEPQKQDCDEKKGVLEESRTEVALTEESSGKRKFRPSLLKRFLCCAAGID